MAGSDTPPLTSAQDSGDFEPAITRLLDRKASIIGHSPYTLQSSAAITKGLELFFARARPDAVVSEVSRMGGGASKEQFIFRLTDVAGNTERLVLRLDPMQTASESDRVREFEMLQAVTGLVPAPEAKWVDGSGGVLGRPFGIFSFVNGVTKPSKGSGGGFSGVGIFFPKELRDSLGKDLVRRLADIHRVDWRNAQLPSFAAPTRDPFQAALWQVNWWSRVWRDDTRHANPLACVAEHWLHANLPKSDEIVVVHGDFRPGNFLFDEDRLEVTAVLDWELVHLGDFHEDLAWILMDAYATTDQGEYLVGGLFGRDAFIRDYEQRSGRMVNADTLHFYEVFSAFKCMGITLASCERAVKSQHNHQEVLLSWLVGIGHIFESDLSKLLQRSLG